MTDESIDYTECRNCGKSRAAHKSGDFFLRCHLESYSRYEAKYEEDYETKRMTLVVDNTDDPVCPACGHAHTDPCDLGIDRLEDGATSRIDCHECGQTFEIRINVSWDWSTHIPDIEKENREHEERHAKRMAENRVRIEAAAKFPPGTRILHKRYGGKLLPGVVLNKEIRSDGYISVMHDGSNYESSADPLDLELEKP